MIHHLLVMLAALAPAGSPAEPPIAHLEHQGIAYEVAYRPVVTHGTRAITTITARGHRLEWCRATTRVAVDAEIRVPEADAASVHRMPGERRISSQFAGSCERNAARIAAARTRQAPEIGALVEHLAAAGRGALLARLGTVRAVATN